MGEALVSMSGGGKLNCELLYIYYGQTTGMFTNEISSDAVYSLHVLIYGTSSITYEADIKNGALTNVVNNASSLQVYITNGVLTINNNYTNDAMITLAKAFNE